MCHFGFNSSRTARRVFLLFQIVIDVTDFLSGTFKGKALGEASRTARTSLLPEGARGVQADRKQTGITGTYEAAGYPCEFLHYKKDHEANFCNRYSLLLISIIVT